MKFRFCYALLFSGCLAFVMGCGPDGTVKPESSVHGKISYQGKPVTGGVVSFHSANSTAPFAGEINDDGTYSVTSAKPGPVRVTIDTSFEEGLPTYVELPAKLNNPDTSGLTYEVKEGEQQHDLIIP